MSRTRIAYMPLAAYPETIADESILAAVDFTAALGCALHVTTFSVEMPRVASPFGGILLTDAPTEERSKAECRRLQGLVQGDSGSRPLVHCSARACVLGSVSEAAAAEARYFDLAVLPWSGEPFTLQDMAQPLIFGSGRPTILTPPSASPARLEHIAIAWDASRVAARALGDALPLLADGGRVTVLTVQDEKPLSGTNLAGALATALERRGFNAQPRDITLNKRTIAEALQDTAFAEGAQLLAMGGFGHSRVRDFILGGATKGILADLRMPVLLAH